MAEKFYTILTNIGKAQIANSGVMGSKVNFVKFKIGDGNGAYYEPTENQKDLVHTVYEGNITDIETDKENPNWMKINLMIPANVGGFMIREYGVFDADGNMLAVAKCAESYKPVAEDGSTKELILRMILAVSNTKNVNMELDPTLVFVTKEELEDLKKSITASLNDMMYETAGGTGTAITLSMQQLKQGYNKTFIASANNNAAATTINGKNLYKPGTTTTPKLISGKAYTVWYNSVGDCFFIKASAEGNATSSHVLAGYTFSNDDDTGLLGDIVNRGTLNKVLALNETFNLPAGYYPGGKVTQNIANNGNLNGNLNCGQSFNIPAGYTSGGTITANSLASQTPSNADASKILSGYSAWVNGSQVWGNAKAYKYSTGVCGSVKLTSSNKTATLDIGFTATLIILKDSKNNIFLVKTPFANSHYKSPGYDVTVSGNQLVFAVTSYSSALVWYLNEYYYEAYGF